MQRHSSPDPLDEVQVEAAPRALVVAGDPLVRDGFVHRLEMLAAGEAEASDDLDEAVRSSNANVLLWDLGPGDEQLGVSFDDYDVPVVVLAGPGRRAVEALGRGATAVLARDVSGPALRSALDTVLHGLVVVEPALLQDDLPRTEPDRDDAEFPDLPDSLTPRETEVIELMAAGLSNKQIADRLGISSHTAKFHIGAILAKLGAATRTEAVVRAVQKGLVLL